MNYKHRVHKWDLNFRHIFRCNICGVAFVRKYYLVSHVMTLHMVGLQTTKTLIILKLFLEHTFHSKTNVKSLIMHCC